jgi:hypothetical protein
MNRAGIGELLADERLNAALSWVLVASVLLGAARSVLRGDLLWGGFAASVATLSLCPPILARDGRTMLPWEVLTLAALPVLGRAFLAAQVGNVATYLAVAALALIVAIELHVFTAVEMNRGFAVGFVVIATMATAGLWALARWIADLYLETGFLASETALMWEFVASTAAGVLAGIVFAWYVGRGTGMASATSGERNHEAGRADGETGRIE